MGGGSYWWGENIVGQITDPIVLPIPNRLVLSPHSYGHGNKWYVQPASFHVLPCPSTAFHSLSPPSASLPPSIPFHSFPSPSIRYMTDPSFPNNMPGVWNGLWGRTAGLTGAPIIVGEWGGGWVAHEFGTKQEAHAVHGSSAHPPLRAYSVH